MPPCSVPSMLDVILCLSLPQQGYVSPSSVVPGLSAASFFLFLMLLFSLSLSLSPGFVIACLPCACTSIHSYSLVRSYLHPSVRSSLFLLISSLSSRLLSVFRSTLLFPHPANDPCKHSSFPPASYPSCVFLYFASILYLPGQSCAHWCLEYPWIFWSWLEVMF